MPSALATTLLDALEREGLLLVHDGTLPSATAVAVGEPVAGSWWSHPMANHIYNALGEIHADLLQLKLVLGKETLVARRLWPAMHSIAIARRPWQLDGLGAAALQLMRDIETAPDPVVVAKVRRDAAAHLARRMLVRAENVHTDSGHHVTAYTSWSAWSARHHVGTIDADDAMATIEGIVDGWAPSRRKRLLPWT